MKICGKCKIEKDLSGFHKSKKEKDGVRHICKECANEYSKKRYENNPEKQKEYDKKWRENNPEYFKEYGKKRYENNPEYRKEYNNSKVNYDTYALQISYAEKVKNIGGFLQVRCTYCGKWYFPTNLSVQHRIRALNSSDGAECRLYCSEECKSVCPIFHKHKFQEEHPMKNESSSREVQPELRQMVFERDEYTCIRCGKQQSDLDIVLHCHHMEGIQQNPIESADMDMCVTVCRDCHEEIHKQKDCRYVDLQCKTGEINE